MLSKIGRQHVQFPHIHGGETGIRIITADMCMKQAPGLGDYLHDLDPSREWDEHLLYMLLFCKVHVMRNFRKRFGNHPAKHLIHYLWDSTSRDQLLNKANTILETIPNQSLKNGLNIRYQRHGILGALCQGQSKIDFQDWNLVRQHTNISESSHFQDNNFTGRRLSLLGAILK
jgi:hypothetical protein